MKIMFAAVLGLMTLRAWAPQDPPLRLIKTIPLEGVKGRFDHCAIDVKGQRLFVAALGNNTLEVVDLAGAKRLHTITGVSKPTGVVYLQDANQIGVANGDDGTFRIFDGGTYGAVAQVENLDDADNVRFDASARRVYLGYGNGALAIFDPASWKLLVTIKLSGHPESFQLDPAGPNVYVNVPDEKQIAVLDREKAKVIATWPMKGFQANFPMALDAANQRLFIGCRKPAQLEILDTSTGRSVAHLPISGDTDDLFYDSNAGRIYISCGEGFVNVVAQQSKDQYELTNKIPTRTGARTSFFSSGRREFFLIVPQHQRSPAEVRLYKVQD